VGTSTDLSRYLFPPSRDVSGKKRQAWQAASCKECSCEQMCSPHSGSDVQLRICSKAPSRCLPSCSGTPDPTSPPNVPSLSRQMCKVEYPRPGQHRWGATNKEVHRTLPGDDQVPHPEWIWTRAITVKAKASDSGPGWCRLDRDYETAAGITSMVLQRSGEAHSPSEERGKTTFQGNRVH
jgi:hypothetical protein